MKIDETKTKCVEMGNRLGLKLKEMVTSEETRQGVQVLHCALISYS